MTTINLPTPMNADDCVMSLQEKQQGHFPDPVRFPPPRGVQGDCGCLLTFWRKLGSYQDEEYVEPEEGERLRNQDKIALECIWQPQWDTRTFVGGDTVQFFNGLNGRHASECNVETPNYITWPRKFTLWELVLQFDHSPEDLGIFYGLSGPLVTVQIGEKWHFRVPLSYFFNPTPTTYRAALCSPLLIPSAKHLKVFMETSRASDPKVNAGRVRCTMNGYIHREIP